MQNRVSDLVPQELTTINSEHFLNSCVDRHYDHFSCRILDCKQCKSTARIPESFVAMHFFNVVFKIQKINQFAASIGLDVEKPKLFGLSGASPPDPVTRGSDPLPLDSAGGTAPDPHYRLALPADCVVGFITRNHKIALYKRRN